MKRIVKIITLFIVIFAIAIGAILLSKNSHEQNDKISIVATNFPAYDFVRAVVGDVANVKMLVKPGAETHDFEPTPQDIIDIQNSKLLVYTGGESDEWIKDILGDIDTTRTQLLAMTDVVEVKEKEIIEGMENTEDQEEKVNHEEEV